MGKQPTKAQQPEYARLRAFVLTVFESGRESSAPSVVRDHFARSADTVRRPGHDRQNAGAW
jgi:hypothetical protein